MTIAASEPSGDMLIRRLLIDNTTAEPIYKQLERQLLVLIKQGQLVTGYSLPSERVLAESLGVSRTTTKRCYDSLRAQGVISGHGRLGTQINPSERLEPGLDRLKGFSEEMRLLNLQPSSRILEKQVVTDRAISSLFGCPATSPLLRLVRLRLGNDIPLSRETAWYNLSLLPDLDQHNLDQSLYDIIRQEYQLPLDGCEQSIEAVTPSEEECETFGFSTPVPCLLIKRRTLTRDQHIVEYVEGLFRGDSYAYKMRLPEV